MHSDKSIAPVGLGAQAPGRGKRGHQGLPPSSRQLTSALGGIFASNATKVKRAALANAQRYASVQRFGEVRGPSVNDCHVSGSSFGSASYPIRRSNRRARYACHASFGLMTSSCRSEEHTSELQ